jgi:glycosyltransferase involved in cell wall biosynthesis
MMPGGNGTLPIRVGLLTGGSDKPYALGLVGALDEQGVMVDMVGSDELDCPEVRRFRRVNFLNLRGDQRNDVGLATKATRVTKYYLRLIRYAATASAPLLHILWNNRFELIDRTLLMACYRLMGKRVVLTAHNVNMGKRDAKDGWVNRATLRVQYRLCSHIFVHTDRMKQEICQDFGVKAPRVSVIPFGLNETIPRENLTKTEARARLRIDGQDKVLLCFGQIAPYKGVEYLISAAKILAGEGVKVRVLIAGKVKRGHEDYGEQIRTVIAASGLTDSVMVRSSFIPDDEVEAYFMAADVVVLPYTDVFQSGVPFLSFAFGVPVIATDVGSLRDDVVDEVTGLICRPKSDDDLARAIRRYFSSPLYRRLEERRDVIREVVGRQHSWTTVGLITKGVYETVLVG